MKTSLLFVAAKQARPDLVVEDDGALAQPKTLVGDDDLTELLLFALAFQWNNIIRRNMIGGSYTDCVVVALCSVCFVCCGV